MGGGGARRCGLGRGLFAGGGWLACGERWVKDDVRGSFGGFVKGVIVAYL